MYALMLAGCDGVLGLQAVKPTVGDTIDAFDCTTRPADPTCHDEDGDGVVDASDDCPATSNPPGPGGTQPDLDSDGVGDACDPHPTTPGDSISEFESFASGFGAWTVGVGSWATGVDLVTSPAGTMTQTRLTHPMIQARHPTIDVAFEFRDLGTNSNATFGAHLDFTGFPGGCRVVGTNEIVIDSNSSNVSTGFSPDVGPNVRYVARYTRDAPNVRCTIATGIMEDPDLDTTDVFVTPSIQVEYVQVTIDSVTIFGTSAP